MALAGGDLDTGAEVEAAFATRYRTFNNRTIKPRDLASSVFCAPLFPDHAILGKVTTLTVSGGPSVDIQAKSAGGQKAAADTKSNRTTKQGDDSEDESDDDSSSRVSSDSDARDRPAAPAVKVVTLANQEKAGFTASILDCVVQMNARLAAFNVPPVVPLAGTSVTEFRRQDPAMIPYLVGVSSAVYNLPRNQTRLFKVYCKHCLNVKTLDPSEFCYATIAETTVSAIKTDAHTIGARMVVNALFPHDMHCTLGREWKLCSLIDRENLGSGICKLKWDQDAVLGSTMDGVKDKFDNYAFLYSAEADNNGHPPGDKIVIHDLHCSSDAVNAAKWDERYNQSLPSREPFYHEVLSEGDFRRMMIRWWFFVVNTFGITDECFHYQHVPVDNSYMTYPHDSKTAKKRTPHLEITNPVLVFGGQAGTTDSSVVPSDDNAPSDADGTILAADTPPAASAADAAGPLRTVSTPAHDDDDDESVHEVMPFSPPRGELLVNQPFHGDYPGRLIHDVKYPVSANPRLKGKMKSGSLFAPFQDMCGFMFLQDGKELPVTVGVGELLYFVGDAVHAERTYPSGDDSWHAGLQCYLSSRYHPFEEDRVDFNYAANAYFSPMHASFTTVAHIKQMADFLLKPLIVMAQYTYLGRVVSERRSGVMRHFQKLGNWIVSSVQIFNGVSASQNAVPSNADETAQVNVTAGAAMMLDGETPAIGSSTAAVAGASTSKAAAVDNTGTAPIGDGVKPTHDDAVSNSNEGPGAPSADGASPTLGSNGVSASEADVPSNPDDTPQVNVTAGASMMPDGDTPAIGSSTAAVEGTTERHAAAAANTGTAHYPSADGGSPTLGTASTQQQAVDDPDAVVNEAARPVVEGSEQESDADVLPAEGVVDAVVARSPYRQLSASTSEEENDLSARRQESEHAPQGPERPRSRRRSPPGSTGKPSKPEVAAGRRTPKRGTSKKKLRGSSSTKRSKKK